MYLTARQREIYEFIRDYIARKGEAPTYQEIGRALRLRSTNAVAKHLRKLEEKGYLSSPWGNRKRALRLVEHGAPSFSIPLLGTVAAGKPIEPIEGSEKIEIPQSLLGSGENFALRVRGDSMIDDGIRDGDVVVVKRQAVAQNGQTVVAVIDGEATVKRFYRKGGRVELRPANPALQPLFLEEGAGDLEIRGVVIGLIRKFQS
ncbi:MAG TPA: transcriptional repressor LexA [Candidatus Polarisedimenticolia bacterium]|jgi:repressor LexA|nr:transcriptional repressor LexA [Candidatus Polarisedimenticolia bacterium]